jgi:hypothetical protein
MIRPRDGGRIEKNRKKRRLRALRESGKGNQTPLPEPTREVPDIPPFWQRLPRFFLYPLHPEPLLYMLFLSCATWLVFIVPAPLPFNFLIVLFGVSLAFIRYAHETLDQTAMGLLTPEEHVVYDDTGRAGLPYKLYGVFAVIGLVTGLAERAGGLFLGAALIYGTLSTPAVIMILAVTRSFRAALNPFTVIRMMTIVGLPYLGLSAFIFLLSASEFTLRALLLPRVPPWPWFPVLAFVPMYFTLIMFNMMGYVIHQYHHLLGVRIQQARQGVRTGNGAAAASGATDSYADLIVSGRIDQALDAAYEARRVDPENVGARDRYHKLLLLSDQKDRLLSHARRYLALLLKKDLASNAIGLFHAMRERDPAFQPDEPAQIPRLAEAARQGRDFALALSLVKGFDKRFRGSGEIPAVYFFAAQTLCENLRRDDAARQILAALLERYPAHPVSDRARQLLNTIEKIAPSS